MKSLFRAIVLIWIALYAIRFLPSFWVYAFNRTDVATIQSVGSDALLRIELIILINIIFLLAYVIVSVGLFYFQNWARSNFVILTILSFLSIMIYGTQVKIEILSMHTYALNLLTGFLIALAFFSNISAEFKISHNKRMQTDAAKLRR